MRYSNHEHGPWSVTSSVGRTLHRTLRHPPTDVINIFKNNFVFLLYCLCVVVLQLTHRENAENVFLFSWPETLNLWPLTSYLSGGVVARCQGMIYSLSNLSSGSRLWHPFWNIFAELPFNHHLPLTWLTSTPIKKKSSYCLLSMYGNHITLLSRIYTHWDDTKNVVFVFVTFEIWRIRSGGH